MRISIPREHGLQGSQERRVALTPRGVHALIHAGHTVTVEHRAGALAGFCDNQYEEAGARIAHRRIEVLAPAELVVGVRWLRPEDVAVMEPDSVVISLSRLDIAPIETRSAFRAAGVISISGDRLEDKAGRFPILDRMSALGGALAPQIAARMLESTSPNRPGVLLTRLPGVAPAEVVVIGAGTLGIEAARRFAGMGCSVYLLDRDLWRLDELAPSLPPNIVTIVASPSTIGHLVAFANVLVTAIRNPDGHVPTIVTREMVRGMRRGAVILDFSIDEGGAVATSRPIWDPDDVYEVDGVLHFSMPNTPSLVARTASRMLSQVYLPFVTMLTEGAHPKAHPTFAPAVWWGDRAEEPK